MSLEILPYSTPTGIRHYVPLEDYQRALDNLDKLENENMAMRAVVQAARCIHHWHDREPDGMVVSKSAVFALWEALAKLQPFLTQPK